MRPGRLSFFAAASWLVPIFVFLMMQAYGGAANGRGSLVPAFTDIAGILMALIGVSCLARYSAKVSARFAQEQQAGGTDEHDARTNMKAMKLTGIATLIVGIGFIFIHVFDLL